MNLKPQILLTVIVTIFPSLTEAQAPENTSDKEQSVFGGEDETVVHPIKVPPGVLEILRKDKQVLRYLDAEQKAAHELTTEPFLASEIHLDGPNEIDVIVMGEGRLRGANVVTFWLFRKLADEYRLVLKATAQSLLVLRARWNGFRIISAGSPIAGSSVEVFYRFDGKQYQYYRKKSEPIH